MCRSRAFRKWPAGSQKGSYEKPKQLLWKMHRNRGPDSLHSPQISYERTERSSKSSSKTNPAGLNLLIRNHDLLMIQQNLLNPWQRTKVPTYYRQDRVESLSPFKFQDSFISHWMTLSHDQTRLLIRGNILLWVIFLSSVVIIFVTLRYVIVGHHS